MDMRIKRPNSQMSDTEKWEFIQRNWPTGKSKIFALDRVTFSDNSPGAGSTAWSSAIVQYQEKEYEITNGNTTNKWIYWSLATPTQFSTSATYPTITADVIIVGANVSGSFVSQWKPGQGMYAEMVIGKLVADQIYVTSLSAISANMGTLTSGTIVGGTYKTATGTGARIEITTAGIIGYNSSNTEISKWDAADGTGNFNHIYSHDYSCDIDLSVADTVIIDTHLGSGGALKLTGSSTSVNLYALAGDRGSDPVAMNIACHDSADLKIGLGALSAFDTHLLFTNASADSRAVFNCPLQAIEYRVGGVKVIGAQGASIADLIAVTSFTLNTGADHVDRGAFNTALGILLGEINTISGTLNTLMARSRTHGLIAT
jgi:hypothetical protein